MEPPAEPTTAPSAAADVPPADPPPVVDPLVPAAPIDPWSPPEGPFTPHVDPSAPPARLRLRILSVIGRSIDLFVWRPLLFIAIGLVAALLSASTSLIYGSGQASNIALTTVASLLIGVVGLLTSLATQIAADDLRAGRETSLGSVGRRAIRRVVPAILATLVIVVTIVGLGIVVLVPATLLVTASPLITLVGGIVFFVIFIVIFLRWSLATSAIALEGAGPLEALGRSSTVIRGNLWRLFGVLVLMGLLIGPLSAAVGMLSVTGTDVLLASALAILLGLIVAPISGILLATMFGDLAGRPDAGSVEADRAGRTIILVGVLVLGIAGVVIAWPKLGAAVTQLAFQRVPEADRGHIYAGAARNPLDPCHPNRISTSFSTSDSIYLGGYFSEIVPAGSSAHVSVFADGQLLTSGDVSGRSQAVACYYELRPIVGAPPATYRLEVTYQNRTIGIGEFTVR
jgi:hypothetical protein